MRKRFNPQIDLGQTPIDKVIIPLKSRDELPPILAGLQWIFRTPGLHEAVFALLERKLQGAKPTRTGRPGMDLWHVLVLGVVRLGLDCNFDRMEHVANFDSLVREIMGLPGFGTRLTFHHRTISDNICLVDEALLAEINALVVQHGLPILKKNAAEKLHVRTDSFVLETDVHYPTDANLLWDAARKCIEISTTLSDTFSLEGWRKQLDWKSRLKTACRKFEKTAALGGPQKDQRILATAGDYLRQAADLEVKVHRTIELLAKQDLQFTQHLKLLELNYFHEHLIRHMDLLERRIIHGETIPHCEKIFSLFEPHTELIKKGKVRPPVEFGHRVLISTSQHGLIIDYKIMGPGSETAEAIPNADRLLWSFPAEGPHQIASLSYDKGFSSEESRGIIRLYIPLVIMPKKGKRTAAECEREAQPPWQRQRDAHSAVESDINSLEHHGLGRCRDKGQRGFNRYAGLGILAYNLHKIGRKLQQTAACAQTAKPQPRARAA